MENKICVLTYDEVEGLLDRMLVRLLDTLCHQTIEVNKLPKVQEVYSMADTAKALKICVGTLYSLIKSGKIKSIKVGRKRMITEAAIQSFLNQKK